MNTLFVISGPPASGKTTLAKALGLHYKIPYISCDDIKDYMHGIDHKEMRAYKILYNLAKINIINTSLIIESNFIPELDRAQVDKISDNILEIFCHAPYEILKERFVKRNKRIGTMSSDISAHKPLYPDTCFDFDTSVTNTDIILENIVQEVNLV